jgi:hypothetical protein
MHSGFAWMLIFGIDDVIELSTLLVTLSAASSLVTGLFTFLKKKAGNIEVKLPDGKVLILSRSMDQEEVSAKIEEIQGRLASFERETAATATGLSFGSELSQVKKIAENAGVTVADRLSSLTPPLLNLASTSPTAAIIEGWNALETETKSLAERAGIAWRSPSQVVSALDKMSLLPNGLAEILRHLINMRNKVVHTHSGDVTEGEAIEFLMLSRSIAERVKQVDAVGAVQKS